ncbi:MAG: hypothetical protein HKN47_06500 [Pirellulaceae bacterium]|nr:hypothetical protein [Pirellulaceae bacterium]
MAIEFFCSQCQQQLSVPDENAGKQAQCPSCNAVVDVPSAAPQAHGAGPTPTNPYSSPVETPGVQPLAFSSGEIQHQVFEPGNCVSVAWRLFNRNPGVLIGAAAVILGTNVLFGVVSSVLQGATGDPQSPAAMLMGSLVSLSGNVVQAFLTIGMIRLCLAIARGQQAEFGMVFSGGPYFWRYLGASILFGIGVFVGMLLLLIPGIYVAITYWPALMLVVDRKCGVFESFEIAGGLAKGNRINSLILGVLAFAINILGLLMCFVGLLATLPIVHLMGVVAYLSMTGQRYATE